jgi:hypothetical protein
MAMNTSSRCNSVARRDVRSTAWLAVAALLFAAGGASAEVRNLEAVGAAPVRRGEQATVSTRDAAVQAALREAVRRVARELLMDGLVPEDGEEAPLDDVLGERMLPYTTRYRILDDQGERPAMFGEDPEITREYVVIVEVSVEAERVQQRLVEAGLLSSEQSTAEATRLRVEVRGLHEYPAYQAMRELLTGAGRAVSAIPVRLERGVAVLDLELPTRSARAWGRDSRDAEQFVERLVSAGPPSLQIRPVQVEAEEIVLAVTWTPPVEPEDY